MKMFEYYKKLIFAPIVAFTLAGCFGDDDDDYRQPITSPPTSTVSVVEVAANNDDFSTLVGLLEATGLDTTLGDLNANFTVFAPNNAAFAALGEETLAALQADPDLLSSILTYHVLNTEVRAAGAIAVAAGTGTVGTVNGARVGLSLQGDDNSLLFVNLAQVTSPDILANNGVIHAIDAVLMPPNDPTDPAPTETIAEIVAASDDFETLESALIAANLVDTFDDADATFTVFAPTDDAFADIPAELLDAIIADGDLLAAILGQHVVADSAIDSISAYSASGTNLTTLNGIEIAVDIDEANRTLTVGGATVTVADIYATNGVVHVIDSVIVGDVELPAVFGSLTEVAAGEDRFSTLVSLLVATDLDEVLGDTDSSYTVFAPNNDAFAALGQATLDELANDPDRLSDILLYHVVPGTVNAEAALGLAGTTVAAANSDNLALSQQGEDLFVNLSRVIDTDILADNGVIHEIDAVLMPVEEPSEPQSIAAIVGANEDFETLLAALQAAELDDDFADESRTFTVFAPTDAAFAAIPESVLNVILSDPELLSDLLLQHAVEGSAVDSVTALSLSGSNVTTISGAEIPISIDTDTRTLQVGGANVVMRDVFASNGIIHVIDAVIVGDLTLPEGNIVEVARAEGLSTLVSLLEATDLDAALADSSASLTVFAPSDAAFAALGQETLDALAADLPRLSNILTYHVLSTEVDATAAIAAAGTTVSALNEDSLGLSLQGANSDQLFVNLARVTVTDIAASNGVIHVIDAVLLPPEADEPTQTITEIVVASDDFDTLEAAVIQAGLADALGAADAQLTVFAPTDEAFAKIPSETLDAILADADTLLAILQQHVVEGVVNAATAYSASGGNVTTLSGAEIGVAIDTDERALLVGGAKVIITDVPATNGIIHVIDTVIVGDVALPAPATP